MDYVVMAGQLFLSLSILIVLHEMGHFFPAKWFNTRVEKFYLFFDPWFELFKIKRGDTEYGIGWLPLGGYVKISGMIDESMDREQMKLPPQPWEFRSKPAWQRLIIMLGGVTVNFILGFILFGLVLWTWGEQYLPNENATYGIHVVDSLGMDMGLMSGDKIVAIGGNPVEKFGGKELRREIIINDEKTVTFDRREKKKTLNIDEKYVDILSRHENKNVQLFVARVPFVLDSVPNPSAAAKAGLVKGDRLIAANGISTPFRDNFIDVARRNAGKEIALSVLRNGKDTINTSLALSSKGLIGAYVKLPNFFFDTKTQEYSFAEAMPAGYRKGYDFLADQIKAFGQIFKGKIKASESLGGFGSIAGMFDTSWNWQRFWRMTAILSLILGFMNLLPIPALDGGHVMFLLYEVISGRKPSDKFMEIATIAGFALVMGLVLFANYQDIRRFFF
ncbi:MAG: RIP metalloprotease RseP [Saprospiraceae bacterium]